MSHFMKEGQSFFPFDPSRLVINNDLPVGNYIVSCHPMRGFYFERVDDFELPDRIYGSSEKMADRIMSTFESRPVTTGVGLTGEKGSGKSLLSKLVCKKAAEKGYPTLIINQDFTGDAFNKLIQDLKQPAVILLDEFEKTYDREKQNELLTLMDGSFPTKKLFVLTSNDRWGLNEFLRNRPGRLYYMMDFTGLEQAFVEQYCVDNLDDKSHIPEILRIASMFMKFNFDMLKALVEEMNRYKESPQDAIKVLNINLSDESSRENYTATLINAEGAPFSRDVWNYSDDGTVWCNPFSVDDDSHQIAIRKVENGSKGDWERYTFRTSGFLHMDGPNLVFATNKTGVKVVLQRTPPKTFNYLAA